MTKSPKKGGGEANDRDNTCSKNWDTKKKKIHPAGVSARPYDSCKIFEGRPHRNAFLKLVHRQYKSFPPDRSCQMEIQNTTGLSNKPRTA